MGKTVFKVTEEMKQQIICLHQQGLMDREIAEKIGGITDGTVFYWRKKLDLKTKFDYSQISKIDTVKFEELFNQGFSDAKIAEQLGMSADGVYSHRMRHGYQRESLAFAKPRKLTSLQKEILIGTLLGDSSFKKGNTVNPAVSCAHGIKQKEYCEYKTEFFKDIGAYCKYHKRTKPDKRNGKFYEDYTLYIPANPELKSWYDALYPKGKKVMPIKLFDFFTEVSLAFMFMDDGAKAGKHGYIICTNCFTEEDVTSFRNMLKEKFNLDTTMLKDNMVYIRTHCQKLFEALITPYMCDCMKYKIHQVS